MRYSHDQKLKLLHILNILDGESDEDFPIKVSHLITRLDSDLNISAERKSIYSDIKALQAYNIDIEYKKGKTAGYYISNRKFEIPELRLLIDAVRSASFITPQKQKNLLKN